MSLLMDVSDYIRRYGTASLSELSQQLRVSPDEIQAAAEVLRQKGRVARRRVLPETAWARHARAAVARAPRPNRPPRANARP